MVNLLYVHILGIVVNYC